MYERTISLYSAGKTFAATGWRVGYSIAPPHLSKPLLTAHAANTFCGAIPLELGVAGAFQHAMKSNYFEVWTAVLGVVAQHQ
jgi:aspartate/methionine/tyrosine aminotransferase